MNGQRPDILTGVFTRLYCDSFFMEPDDWLEQAKDVIGFPVWADDDETIPSLIVELYEEEYETLYREAQSFEEEEFPYWLPSQHLYIFGPRGLSGPGDFCTTIDGVQGVVVNNLRHTGIAIVCLCSESFNWPNKIGVLGVPNQNAPAVGASLDKFEPMSSTLFREIFHLLNPDRSPDFECTALLLSIQIFRKKN